MEKSRDDSRMEGVCLLDWRSGERRDAIEEKGGTYGHTWEVSFAKSADWAAVAGLYACRASVSSGNHLFSRGNTSAQHFERTYECPQTGTARLCFVDCVVMFGRHGSLVEDYAVSGPRNSHSYISPDFDLLDQPGTKEEARESNETLRKFRGATWNGVETAAIAARKWWIGRSPSAAAIFGVFASYQREAKAGRRRTASPSVTSRVRTLLPGAAVW